MYDNSRIARWKFYHFNIKVPMKRNFAKYFLDWLKKIT